MMSLLVQSVLSFVLVNQIEITHQFIFSPKVVMSEIMHAIESRQLFLDPVWYTPSDDGNPASLLGD
jgi:hypothetical protein